ASRPAPGKSADKPNDATIIEAAYGQVREKMPDHALAWSGIGSMASSLITLLASSPDFRTRAKNHPELMPNIARLANVDEDDRLGQVRFLGMVIRVLDDEELVVLHTEQRRGYRVKVRGILNIAQLNTLLGSVLIGDPAQGLLEGTP